jgi:hypothetical protein
VQGRGKERRKGRKERGKGKGERKRELGRDGVRLEEEQVFI